MSNRNLTQLLSIIAHTIAYPHLWTIHVKSRVQNHNNTKCRDTITKLYVHQTMLCAYTSDDIPEIVPMVVLTMTASTRLLLPSS